MNRLAAFAFTLLVISTLASAAQEHAKEDKPKDSDVQGKQAKQVAG